jgi:hypothetical protein
MWACQFGRPLMEIDFMAQINQKVTMDQIVQEMREIKEALAKSMDFKIDRIVEDARRRQRESGRTILAPPVQPRHS